MVFFRSLIVDFFTEDLEEELLAEIMHLILNQDAHLYSVALQSGSGNALSTLRENTFE